MSGNDGNSLLRLQEPRTLLWFLGEDMDGVDRPGRWRGIKRRLGLKRMGCCSASWGFRPTTMSVREDDEEDDEYETQVQAQTQAQEGLDQASPERSPGGGCVGQAPATPGMNLATALAAERHMRATQDGAAAAAGPTDDGAPTTPLRVSLMRLLEESEGGDCEMEKEKGGGNDHVCCVCMGRKKDAAFIPCGHTFCRVCSRELWLNRGSCPLCNRSILEILDIF